jgi:hypothetical protein
MSKRRRRYFSFVIHRFGVNTHMIKSTKHTFAAQWLPSFVSYLFASGTHDNTTVGDVTWR